MARFEESKRVTAAFKAPRRRGFFARQNFACCQTCGIHAVDDDKAENYVFYHAQDREELEKTGACFLAFCGDGKMICECLEGAGLKAEWDGSLQTRIKMVLPWHRSVRN